MNDKNILDSFDKSIQVIVESKKLINEIQLAIELILILKNPKEIRAPDSKNCDLRIKENCVEVVKDIDVVFHIAGVTGGIGFTKKHPGSVFYDNLMMGTNIIEESRKANVEKFISTGTVCSYPKFSPIPFNEVDIWNGYPEETNASYGLSKKNANCSISSLSRRIWI